jgi:hypothetical protein
MQIDDENSKNSIFSTIFMVFIIAFPLVPSDKIFPDFLSDESQPIKILLNLIGRWYARRWWETLGRRISSLFENRQPPQWSCWILCHTQLNLDADYYKSFRLPKIAFETITIHGSSRNGNMLKMEKKCGCMRCLCGK